MPTVLITGAGRGIGLEFALQYRALGWRVIATVRGIRPMALLDKVQFEAIDMRDFTSVEALAERLQGEKIDLFIANAGVSAARQVESAHDAQAWQEMHAVNVAAPTLLATRLLPAVAAAEGKMIAISSQMGSIADSSGDYVGYRASKAALNAAWRALALGARNRPLTIAMLHPGWVQTEMGGSSAPLAAARSVEAMRGVIAGLTPADTGAFLNHRGEPLPW